MKKEGIYTTVSPFWPHNGHMGGWVPEEWGIEGYSGKDELWSVMYFSDTLKNAYKEWVRYLYTEPNPHTGIPLSQDPALAFSIDSRYPAWYSCVMPKAAEISCIMI